MSAGVGIWKDVLLKAAHGVVQKPPIEATVSEISFAPSQPILALVRQIFFPGAMVQRTHVLFAAADGGTGVSVICEQVGRALAEMSGATVAIVEASSSPVGTPALKKSPGNNTGTEWWRRYSTQIAENVWRVSSGLMSNWPYQGSESTDLPFDYVLFAAQVTDSEMPLFCGACDGAVLVLTANRTRRESALRAREHLLQCNAELLGTVLDGRTFPVPDPIYRRL